MRLDDVLGSGAFDDLFLALTFEGKNPPLVSESEWNPTAVGTNWPSPDQWCLITVVWKDVPTEDLDVTVSTQNLYFKDRTMYWGSGICFTLPTYDLLKDFPNTNMWNFLTKYSIEEMRIDIPEFLSEPFLKIGFEGLPDDPEKLVASINEGCKIQQWVEWANQGSDPSTEPEWHK